MVGLQCYCAQCFSHEWGHFLQKSSSCKTGWHVFVTQHILNLIIFFGLRRLLNSFIKKYIFKCVNSLYEPILLFKIELEA